MSSLQALAKATGLSVSTVSEILRDKPGYQEETRQRVIAAAQRLQYRPSMAARQLRSGRSGWLGVLMDLDHPGVNLARLAGLERAALARGYRLVVGRLAAGETLEAFLARGLDGLFWLHPPQLGRAGLSTSAGQANVVAADAPLSPAGGSVKLDYDAGVAEAVTHLRARGCRRLALVAEEVDSLRVFQKPFRKAGGQAAEEWCLPVAVDDGPVAGPAVEDWFRKAAVDGVLATSDRVAALLVKSLRAMKKAVPREVAVVGFGNEAGAAWLDPALTTLDGQPDDWARAAMELMARLLDKAPLAARERTVLIRPQLVVRESA